MALTARNILILIALCLATASFIAAGPLVAVAVLLVCVALLLPG